MNDLASSEYNFGDMEERLYRTYSAEKELYMEVLFLARKLRDALKSSKPISDVVNTLRKKKEVMDRIDSLETVIEKEKGEYKELKLHSAKLTGIIDELSKLIEEILAVERENEVLLTTASSRSFSGSGPFYTPEIAVSRYLGDIGG